MRKQLCVCLVLLLVAVSLHAQQAETSSASPFLGSWSGTWDAVGASGGGFALVLAKTSDAAANASPLAGSVDVTGEPAYKATLKTIAIDGKKATLIYDFPLDEHLEVTLTGTLDGDSIKGTWEVRPKGGGDLVADGGWNVKKK